MGRREVQRNGEERWRGKGEGGGEGSREERGRRGIERCVNTAYRLF